MKLSKTSTHAALAMAYLAGRRNDGLVQARTVAHHLEIPTDSALKILQALTRRGLIHSQLGRTGGYRLAAPPHTLNLLQVIEAIDGPISGDIPLRRKSPNRSCIVLQDLCTKVTDRIRNELAGATVADLMAEPDTDTAPATLQVA